MAGIINRTCLLSAIVLLASTIATTVVAEEDTAPAGKTTVEILQILEKRISVDFKEAHLRDVFRNLSNLTGVDFIVDLDEPEPDEEDQIEDYFVDKDDDEELLVIDDNILDLQVKEMRTRTVLVWIGRLCDLQISVVNEAIYVHRSLTEEEVVRRTISLDVSDLLNPPRDASPLFKED